MHQRTNKGNGRGGEVAQSFAYSCIIEKLKAIQGLKLEDREKYFNDDKGKTKNQQRIRWANRLIFRR